MKKKHSSFELVLSSLPKKSNALTLQAGITEQELTVINDSRLKYALLMNGDESCYIDAKELHAALEKPYGEFRLWYLKVVKPYIIEAESRIIEVTESGRQRIITHDSMLQKRNMEENNDLPKRKDIGDKKQIFVPLDVAQDLAMLTRNDAGKEIRRYFRTVNKVFEKCMSNNLIRFTAEKASKSAAQHAALVRYEETGKYDLVAQAKGKKRFNALVSKICGSRINPETNLAEYTDIQRLVSKLIERGDSDQLIFEKMGVA